MPLTLEQKKQFMEANKSRGLTEYEIAAFLREMDPGPDTEDFLKSLVRPEPPHIFSASQMMAHFPIDVYDVAKGSVQAFLPTREPISPRSIERGTAGQLGPPPLALLAIDMFAKRPSPELRQRMLAGGTIPPGELRDYVLRGIASGMGASIGLSKENGVIKFDVNTMTRRMEEHPAQFLADWSALISIPARVAEGVATVSKLSEAASIAGRTARVAELVDPSVLAMKALGFGIERVGETMQPGARLIRPEIEPLALKYDLEPPASVKTASKATAIAEARAFARDYGVERINKFGADINKIADNAVIKIGGSPDVMVAGKNLLEGYQKVSELFGAAKNSLYEKVTGTIPGAPEISETQNLLARIITTKRSTSASAPGDLDYYTKLQMDVITASTFDDIWNIKKDVNSRITGRDPFAVRDQANYKGLIGTLNKDLDNTILKNRPDLSGALTAADRFYDMGREKLNGSVARIISNNSPDQVVAALFNNPQTLSIIDIEPLKEFAGDKLPDIQSAFAVMLIKKSKTVDGKWNPTRMQTLLDQYGVKLTEILPPETVEAFRDIGTLTLASKNLAKLEGAHNAMFGIDQILQDEKTASLIGQIGSTIAGGVDKLSATAFVTGLLNFLTVDTVARWIMSPGGQRYLTEGTLTGHGATAVGSAIRYAAPVTGRVGRLTDAAFLELENRRRAAERPSQGAERPRQ